MFNVQHVDYVDFNYVVYFINSSFQGPTKEWHSEEELRIATSILGRFQLLLRATVFEYVGVQ